MNTIKKTYTIFLFFSIIILSATSAICMKKQKKVKNFYAKNYRLKKKKPKLTINTIYSHLKKKRKCLTKSPMSPRSYIKNQPRANSQPPIKTKKFENRRITFYRKKYRKKMPKKTIFKKQASKELNLILDELNSIIDIELNNWYKV